jgi:hypothetical protein
MLAHPVHGDVAAERRQTVGEGASEPAAGPGHERNLAFEHAIRHRRNPSIASTGIEPPIGRLRQSPRRIGVVRRKTASVRLTGWVATA